MNVRINGKSHDVEPGATIARTLEALDIRVDFAAVALNRTFVPKSRIAETRLEPGDELEVLVPHQGG